MKFAINWVLGLFRKPDVEITFEPEVEAWPFPVPAKKKPKVAKATTRTKKPAVVAKTAVKKTAKKKAK